MYKISQCQAWLHKSYCSLLFLTRDSNASGKKKFSMFNLIALNKQWIFDIMELINRLICPYVNSENGKENREVKQRKSTTVKCDSISCEFISQVTYKHVSRLVTKLGCQYVLDCVLLNLANITTRLNLILNMWKSHFQRKCHSKFNSPTPISTQSNYLSHVSFKALFLN